MSPRHPSAVRPEMQSMSIDRAPDETWALTPGMPPTFKEAWARLTTVSTERKDMPIYSGVIRYFPDALAEIAKLSKIGNDKHNPGEPLHWSRGKSTDELDCLVRHLLEAGTLDTDGILHDVKICWRALANLQKLLERERKLSISPGSKL